MTTSTVIPHSPRGLKQQCLSYAEVLAQSISVIAPSTVPAAVVGLVFATAGNGTWLSFLLGMVGLILVSFNINQFASRSASPGSLYTYIVKGLGPMAGVLSGWGMLLAYLLTGMSTLCGFAIFSQIILAQLSIQLPILVLFLLGAGLAGAVAYKDIQLSAKLMLVFEGVSIVAVIALGVILWTHKGFSIDHAQFTLQGASPGGILTGIVLVVFGFSGFESSTSLGDEAKDPLRTIPRSIVHSTLFTGGFFLFMAYVVVLGFQGTGLNLGETEAPLAYLSKSLGLGLLGELISIGVVLSFFSCTLACINSTARLVFSMAGHGLFHDALSEAHEANQTPHLAVIASTLVTFLVPAIVVTSGVSPFEAQGYFGTLCSFGFLLVYILVSIAAPIYLKALGRLRWQDVTWSALAVLFMMLPLLGTTGIPGSALFKMPEFPSNIFPWLFLAYMAIGLAWYLIQRARSPHFVPSMKQAVEDVHQRYGDVKELSETSSSNRR